MRVQVTMQIMTIQETVKYRRHQTDPVYEGWDCASSTQNENTHYNGMMVSVIVQVAVLNVRKLHKIEAFIDDDAPGAMDAFKAFKKLSGQVFADAQAAKAKGSSLQTEFAAIQTFRIKQKEQRKRKIVHPQIMATIAEELSDYETTCNE